MTDDADVLLLTWLTQHGQDVVIKRREDQGREHWYAVTSHPPRRAGSGPTFTAALANLAKSLTKGR